MTAIVKHDQSPVADLKKPYSNRVRTDKQVTGAIELAYLRGVQAGAEKERKDIIVCIRSGHFSGSEEIVSMIKRRN